MIRPFLSEVKTEGGVSSYEIRDLTPGATYDLELYATNSIKQNTTKEFIFQTPLDPAQMGRIVAEAKAHFPAPPRSISALLSRANPSLSVAPSTICHHDIASFLQRIPDCLFSVQVASVPPAGFFSCSPPFDMSLRPTSDQTNVLATAVGTYPPLGPDIVGRSHLSFSPQPFVASETVYPPTSSSTLSCLDTLSAHPLFHFCQLVMQRRKGVNYSTTRVVFSFGRLKRTILRTHETAFIFPPVFILYTHIHVYFIYPYSMLV
ncbi:unnamed protein product [Protopolystoma xenopodis]|uniref:Uncharacterized protein n=1 Tax=Protopolystoma xenopodis TaxID=117903 RepID=A0A3S5C3W0_9PLAT|nr:unnamed protein product [Protopolystoma xenopodis]